MAPNERKRTQRERLLRGMVEVANRSGYAGASVSTVIAQAGVSRPTFYEYFTDRDDCFRSSIEHVQQQLLTRITDALEGVPPHGALAHTVRALVEYACEEPVAARFLMGESMAGGSGALDTRDRAIAQIAAVVERAQQEASDGDVVPDLALAVALRSVYRMLATRLRRGELTISKLTDDLLAWLAAYDRPSCERRWQALTPGPAPARSPHVPDVPIQQSPSVLPPGRPRLPAREIAENHRLRILYATARLAEQKGYLATKVADITTLARIDGSAFYRHFADKQEAFSAVHELGFQHVMDVTAEAFFAPEGWPRRSWEAGRALTQLLQDNPLVAHVGFVEAYTVGSSAVQRIEDSHVAFVFFLQEGLVQRPESPPPSRVAMEAIVAAIFEIVYIKVRQPGEPEIAAMLPHVAHMWLTPFLGIEEADAFIDAQMRTEHEDEHQ
ncbi:MAG TPA: TetR/AcrR family transcriptional regulator [Solirubrobacteraceae bacterium]|nr:TetR/AcrR family transcriptional regulator [Solirubrobacteraceae bacterium]